ncbi:MAG: hypothetical protein KGM49_07860 [Sphingomonadales bacterium]|nr:hypothetical protein [Sphingomonadales bacterium]
MRRLRRIAARGNVGNAVGQGPSGHERKAESLRDQLFVQPVPDPVFLTNCASRSNR